jgi:hypothetical protein
MSVSQTMHVTFGGISLKVCSDVGLAYTDQQDMVGYDRGKQDITRPKRPFAYQDSLFYLYYSQHHCIERQAVG